MNRNTVIFLIALLVGAAALIGSAVMVRPINTQRSDLRLVYNPNVTSNLPPKMALLRTFLGSFKSIVANALWMRTESLKQEGKFHEAMELAEMISDLQPRFPEVWSFQSWNMAYNISVATHTQRERWMWVQRGIELLRDRGIPANPTSTKLYRQLGWTFLHKIGQFSDDMHWYYKQQLAEQWHWLLGPPNRVMSPRLDEKGKPVLDDLGEPIMEYGEIVAFRPIAQMDQEFFADDVLRPEIRESLSQLARQYPMWADEFIRLRAANPFSFNRQVERTRRRIEERFDDVHEALNRMVDRNSRMLAKLGADPVGEFLKAYPQAKASLDLFNGLGLELGESLLVELSRSKMRREAKLLGYPIRDPPAQDKAKVEALTQWMTDNQPQARELREQVVLPFIRAMVLRKEFHMSPTFMLDLMEGHWLVEAGKAKPTPLPLDWRHPAAHGLYWSALGVLVGQDRLLRDETQHFTQLNTDRQVIHSIQALTHSGSIVFDPYTNYYTQLPDPRYIDGYILAVDTAMGRIDPATVNESVPNSFNAGRENFMQWAVRLCYFWGAPKKAEELYQQLLVAYQNKHGRLDRYSMPLDDYIVFEINEDITNLDDARKVIGGLIRTAIEQGYVNGRPDVAQQRMKMAKDAYDYYQKEQGRKTPGASRDRMSLKPFGQMVADALTLFMTAPHAPPPQGVPLPTKELAWRNIPDYLDAEQKTPNPLKQRVWDRIQPTLYAQINLLNEQLPDDLSVADPARLFLEPPRMPAYREAHGRADPAQVRTRGN